MISECFRKRSGSTCGVCFPLKRQGSARSSVNSSKLYSKEVSKTSIHSYFTVLQARIFLFLDDQLWSPLFSNQCILWREKLTLNLSGENHRLNNWIAIHVSSLKLINLIADDFLKNPWRIAISYSFTNSYEINVVYWFLCKHVWSIAIRPIGFFFFFFLPLEFHHRFWDVMQANATASSRNWGL